MALTVETGAGIAGADCYGDVSSCSAYAIAYYGSALTGSAADKEAAIRRAAAYMNGIAWKGTRTYGRDQGLAWPRTGVTDCEMYAIGVSEIPLDVISAQHELARAEFKSPGILTPAASKAKAVVTMEKVDVIERHYDTDALTGSVDDVRPIVTAAMDRLKCYIVGKVGYAVPAAVVV